MTLEISERTMLDDLVRELPTARGILKKFGILYGGGIVDLRTAAQEEGVAVGPLVTELNQAMQSQAQSHKFNLADARPDEIADYIEQTYHVSLRERLSRLDELLRRTLEQNPAERALPPLRVIFLTLRNDLEQHMTMEEQILFPIVRQVARQRHEMAPGVNEQPVPQEINPIRQMEEEHKHVEAALNEIHELSGNYTPGAGQDSLRPLYRELDEMDKELREHIRVENDYLWPVRTRRPQ